MISPCFSMAPGTAMSSSPELWLAFRAFTWHFEPTPGNSIYQRSSTPLCDGKHLVPIDNPSGMRPTSGRPKPRMPSKGPWMRDLAEPREAQALLLSRYPERRSAWSTSGSSRGAAPQISQLSPTNFAGQGAINSKPFFMKACV